MLRGKWGHSFSRLHQVPHPVAHSFFPCLVATAFPKSKSRLFSALQAALFQWWLMAHWCTVTCPGASVLNWHLYFQVFYCYPTLKLCRHLAPSCAPSVSCWQTCDHHSKATQPSLAVRTSKERLPSLGTLRALLRSRVRGECHCFKDTGRWLQWALPWLNM